MSSSLSAGGRIFPTASTVKLKRKCAVTPSSTERQYLSRTNTSLSLFSSSFAAMFEPARGGGRLSASAILVAFVCQKYPLKDPAVVVEKFFRVMEAWDWPNPIMLRQPSADDARAWNPRLNPRDRAHLAPIVTPAHPSMNSSYNIGAPQLLSLIHI